MESEHQPLAAGASSELYSQDTHTASESAFSHESRDVSSKPRGDGTPWYVLPKRYIIAIMAFLGFANIYALRVNLSVALVAMTTNRSVVINGTLHTIAGPEFDWSSHLKGQILASFFYGYIFTQLPGATSLAFWYQGQLAQVEEHWSPDHKVRRFKSHTWKIYLSVSLSCYLANRFGGKYVFGGGVVATALLTLPTPLMTTWSPYMLIILRVLEGLFE
ncbi:hypothetical protein EGW08_007312, partial [Elysia chlorotica]